MPDCDEVLDQSARAGGVVGDDEITIGVRQRSVNQDDGKPAAQQEEDAGPRPVASGRQEETFDAVSDEVLDVFSFQAEIALAVAEKNPVSRLPSRVFRPSDDRSEKWIDHAGNDEA